jgi:hypothetical protein
VTDRNGRGRVDFRVTLDAGMKTVSAPLLVHNLIIWVVMWSYVDCRCPFELNFRTSYTIRSGPSPYIPPNQKKKILVGSLLNSIHL